MRYLVLCALFLVGCETQDPRGPLVIHPVEKYGSAPKVVNYGPWYIAANDACTLVGGNQDFNIETNGQFERNTLRMKLRTNMPLTAPPRLRINTLDKPILVEGRRRHFGFNLPFAAHEVARYAEDHAYLFVTYQPLGSTTTREGFLALKPLLTGLGALAKNCG